MKDFVWKFEYILSLLLFFGLIGALVGAFMIGSMELTNTIIVSLVASFAAMIGYFFRNNSRQEEIDEEVKRIQKEEEESSNFK